MHNISGHSHFFDRVRLVHLANAIDLEVKHDAARLLVGPASGQGAKELIIFQRPAAISTCSIIAQVLEEQGTIAANAGLAVVGQGWIPCTDCHQIGGIYDNLETWLDCPRCNGTGIIRYQR